MGQKIIATIGSFDGVHRGHAMLLGQMRDLAQHYGEAELHVVTFSPYPSDVLRPDLRIEHLVAPEERNQLLRELGGVKVHDLPFTEALASMSAEAFMEDVLLRQIGVTALVIGYDHHFGKGASLSIEDYERLGQRLGIAIHRGRSYQVDGEVVSSTRIRECIKSGDVARAALLLGRRYTLRGKVVQGQQLGRKLGYPTANIDLGYATQVLPQDGVYLARAYLREGGREAEYKAMLYIGTRPSIDQVTMLRSIEAHLLDFDRDIYGEELVIQLERFFLPEQRFASKEELKLALSLYEASVRMYFALEERQVSEATQILHEAELRYGDRLTPSTAPILLRLHESLSRAPHREASSSHSSNFH